MVYHKIPVTASIPWKTGNWQTCSPFTSGSTNYMTLIVLCRNTYATLNKVHFVDADYYQTTTTHSGLISDLILVRLWTTSAHWCHTMTRTLIPFQDALSGLFNVTIFAVGSTINRFHTQQNNNYVKASGQQTGTIISSMLLSTEIAYVVWGGWLELWTWCKVLFSPLAWCLHQSYF